MTIPSTQIWGSAVKIFKYTEYIQGINYSPKLAEILHILRHFHFNFTYLFAYKFFFWQNLKLEKLRNCFEINDNVKFWLNIDG